MKITFELTDTATDRALLAQLAAVLSPDAVTIHELDIKPEAQNEETKPSQRNNGIKAQNEEVKERKPRVRKEGVNLGGRKPTDKALQARQAIRNLRAMRWKREGFTSLDLAKHLGVARHTAHNALEWMATNDNIVYKAGLGPKPDDVLKGKAPALWKWRIINGGQ